MLKAIAKTIGAFLAMAGFVLAMPGLIIFIIGEQLANLAEP